MLTQEKANALAEYLNKDEARAQKLAKMEAEDAVKALSADGLEYTADELAEFAEAVEKSSDAKGELSEEALEGVSGGCWIVIPIVIGIGVIAWKRVRR